MKAKNDFLRQKILDSNNKHCFIDVENALFSGREKCLSLPEKDRYLFELEQVLDSIQTPVDEEDVLVGKMNEDFWPEENGPLQYVSCGLRSAGHITWDWARILQKGLFSFAEEMEETAKRDPNRYSLNAAHVSRRAFQAVERLALRWSEAAYKKSLEVPDGENRKCLQRAAEALKKVPGGPAWDFFSALQSFWFWHLICSAVLGARDFTPGRMDQYLLPYYRRDIAQGKLTPGEAEELLTQCFLRMNEVAGTATDDYCPKPIRCNASKQYITLGGWDQEGNLLYNELSEIIVKAVKQCGLSQPTLNFRLTDDMPDEVWNLAAQAALSPSIPNFFNEKIIRNTLSEKGFSGEDCCNFDFTACNRVNIPGKLTNMMERIDHFDNTVACFLETLHECPEAESVEEILIHLRKSVRKRIRDYNVRNYFHSFQLFLLDSLCVDECREKGMDIYNLATAHYNYLHWMFTGIATIGDSLNAIEEMVFRTKRYTLKEFLQIVDSDFRGQESLRQELLNSRFHFGNGNPESDRLTIAAANALLDAAEEESVSSGTIISCSFYSLLTHWSFGKILPATPDGRAAGIPISENMSPVYGRDVSGPTAVLRSVASLPLNRLICGGLNMKFGTVLSPEKIAALLKSFFMMGGLHIGLSMVDIQTLKDAQKNPEKHRTLLVRKYGFSEYFVSLSPEYQEEMIRRTEYQ